MKECLKRSIAQGGVLQTERKGKKIKPSLWRFFTKKGEGKKENQTRGITKGVNADGEKKKGIKKKGGLPKEHHLYRKEEGNTKRSSKQKGGGRIYREGGEDLGPNTSSKKGGPTSGGRGG